MRFRITPPHRAGRIMKREVGFYWVDGDLVASDEPIVAQWDGQRWSAPGWEGSIPDGQVIVISGRIEPPAHSK